MKKIPILVLIFSIICSVVFGGEQLEFFNNDKKLEWELYIAGNNLFLSGNETEAIKKWKESAAKLNFHAAARLYHEDLKSQKKEFASLYEPILKSKFGISNYLTLKYLGSGEPEKLDAQKKEVVKSMMELEGTEDFWALSIVGNFFTDNFANKEEFLTGVRFLLKAAEGGYSPAQDKMGMLYWEGSATFNKDLNKAKMWLGKAAALKDKYACLHLAQIYHKGSDDIPPDIPKSIPFYEEAARQGLNDAILNLGLIFEEGQGVEKNAEKSHKYLSSLLDCEDVEVYKFLGARYFYSKEEWKDKKKGLLWFEKAAEVGTLVEKYKYAELFYSDPDVRDYGKAHTLFLKLVPKDGVISQQIQILIYLRLGAIYFNGYGVKKDYLESKKYYDKVDHTSEALEANIAMYLNGWGVKQSDDMVINYINRLMDPARAKGFVPGPYFYILGNIYKKRGDAAKCLENYRLGALSNHEESMQELKKLYTPLGAEEACDIGDIYLALLKFEEAEKYYLKEEAKNNLRCRYNGIRLLNIENFKGFDAAKSFENMKKFAEENFADYTEKIDHTMVDRVIDPELIGVPLKARAYFWLAVQSKKKIEKNDDKVKAYDESVSYFLSAEKSGCWFAGLNAATLLLKSENPISWPKGKEILERLHKEKNPFAAALLGAYFGMVKFGKPDYQKAKDYNTDATTWDTNTQWRNFSIDTMLKKAAVQMLQNSDK